MSRDLSVPLLNICDGFLGIHRQIWIAEAVSQRRNGPIVGDLTQDLDNVLKEGGVADARFRQGDGICFTTARSVLEEKGPRPSWMSVVPNLSRRSSPK